MNVQGARDRGHRLNMMSLDGITHDGYDGGDDDAGCFCKQGSLSGDTIRGRT